MYKLLLTKSSEKELSSLPRKINQRVAQALDELTIYGAKASNTKKLQTPFPGYRKRVGDYRILFEVNDDFIIVYRINKRSEAYR